MALFALLIISTKWIQPKPVQFEPHYKSAYMFLGKSGFLQSTSYQADPGSLTILVMAGCSSSGMLGDKLLLRDSLLFACAYGKLNVLTRNTAI